MPKWRGELRAECPSQNVSTGGSLPVLYAQSGSDAVPPNFTNLCRSYNCRGLLLLLATFTVAGPAPNPPWSEGVGSTSVPHFGGLGGNNAGETDFEGHSSIIYTGRTWADDQSSSIVMSNVTGKTSIDVLVRAATVTQNSYIGQFIFPTGLGAGTFNLEKSVDGTVTVLAT